MPWSLAPDHALCAEFFKKKGDRSKAKENIPKGIELMREGGAGGWVSKYERDRFLSPKRIIPIYCGSSPLTKFCILPSMLLPHRILSAYDILPQ
jgi:hypothetical protein